MTMNQDRPYHSATLSSSIYSAGVRLRLYRKTSSPGVFIVVTDDTAVASFHFSQRKLDRFITALQRESELLKAPKVGERRRAPSDHPELSGCEVIRAEDARSGPLVGAHARRWFVYRGSAVGVWTTDAEVADWTVIS